LAKNNLASKAVVIQLMLPVVLMLGLLVVVEFTHLDKWVSGLAFDANLQAFPMKRDFLFDTVFHDWARKIPMAVAVLTLAALASTVFNQNVILRHAALFVFLSMLITTGLIALMKSSSSIHCPYDLVSYGGQFQETGLLDFSARIQAPGKCWPSGHASGGFSLLALYYAARIYKPEYRTPALVFALAIGFLFTVSQTIRGAHYLSHGIWSLLFVWLANELLYLVWVGLGRNK